MSRSRTAVLLALALALAAPAASWARAGGGGGGGGFGGGGFGGGSGPANRPYGSSGQPPGEGLWLLIPVFAAGALVVFGPDIATRYARRRARLLEAATVQEMSTAGQSAGQREFVALTDRVRLCFFKVQDAWSSRDVSVSRPFVSDALYERHRAQLAKMERRHLKNRIKDLVLRDVRVVRLERGPDGKTARCAARIEASARDWVADLGRGVVVDGDPDEHRRFVEYWSFSRHPVSGWVLDEIRRRDRGLWAVKTRTFNP